MTRASYWQLHPLLTTLLTSVHHAHSLLASVHHTQNLTDICSQYSQSYWHPCPLLSQPYWHLCTILTTSLASEHNTHNLTGLCAPCSQANCPMSTMLTSLLSYFHHAYSLLASYTLVHKPTGLCDPCSQAYWHLWTNILTRLYLKNNSFIPDMITRTPLSLKYINLLLSHRMMSHFLHDCHKVVVMYSVDLHLYCCCSTQHWCLWLTLDHVSITPVLLILCFLYTYTYCSQCVWLSVSHLHTYTNTLLPTSHSIPMLTEMIVETTP